MSKRLSTTDLASVVAMTAANLPKEEFPGNYVRGYHQALKSFWYCAQTMAKTWDIYRQVTNNQINQLKEWIKFYPNQTKKNNSPVIAFVYGIYEEPEGIYVDHIMDEIIQNPLYDYQLVAFRHLIGGVCNFSADERVSI